MSLGFVWLFLLPDNRTQRNLWHGAIGARVARIEFVRLGAGQVIGEGPGVPGAFG